MWLVWRKADKGSLPDICPRIGFSSTAQGIAVGATAALEASDILVRGGAILHLGSAASGPHPLMKTHGLDPLIPLQAAPDAQQPAGSGEGQAQQPAQRPAPPLRQCGGRTAPRDGSGLLAGQPSVDPAAAARAAEGGVRYLWLPVDRDNVRFRSHAALTSYANANCLLRCRILPIYCLFVCSAHPLIHRSPNFIPAQADRFGLQRELPAATAFCAAHLAAQRTVLIVCPDGRERSSAAAAALLACCCGHRGGADSSVREEDDVADSSGPVDFMFLGLKPVRELPSTSIIQAGLLNSCRSQRMCPHSCQLIS